MQIVELLRSMDVFETLDESRLQEIASLGEQRVPAGTVLFREGDVADSLLIVTAGRIRVSTRDATGRERTLAVHRDGEFFGETGVLAGEPRNGNAIAEVDSGVLVVPKAEFDRLLAANPVVIRTMLRVVAQRQMQANIRLVEEDTDPEVARQGAGRVFAVFSPRGGAGKTTVAVNLAVLLARMFPDRVALLDLAVTFGHAGLHLGLYPSDGIASLEAERLENLDRETLNHCAYLHGSSLRLYVGATRPEEGEAVTGEHVKAVLALMRRQYLYVVVDLPSSFSEPTLAAMELADRLILLMTPDLAALRDVREVLRLFNDTIRVPRAKHCYVLNAPAPVRPLSREQIEGPLELQLHVEIPHGGEAVYKAYLKGEPVVVGQASGTMAKALEKLAGELLDGAVKPLPVAAAAAGERGGLLSKLFSKKA